MINLAISWFIDLKSVVKYVFMYGFCVYGMGFSKV